MHIYMASPKIIQYIFTYILSVRDALAVMLQHLAKLHKVTKLKEILATLKMIKCHKQQRSLKNITKTKPFYNITNKSENSVVDQTSNYAPDLLKVRIYSLKKDSSSKSNLTSLVSRKT